MGHGNSSGDGGQKVTFSIPALATLILALLGASGGGVAVFKGDKESVEVAVMKTEVQEIKRRLGNLEEEFKENNRLLRIALSRLREDAR